MNRFNLLTWTAALALALCACVSTTKPRVHGAQRQPMLSASALTPPRYTQVEIAAQQVQKHVYIQ